ncbi:MAG: sugar kinase [Candidatus Hydrogenedentes bacterium]|nr:sugar kinase [Candidatus Hydrogenedentota bacterium]
MPVDLVTVGLVCADVMVRPVNEVPERGRLGLVPQLEMHVGGLAGVTAAVYCRLGGSAAFIGRVGQDSFGDHLVNSLAAFGVDTHGVRRDPERRSSATVVLISSDGERTFLHHTGATAALSEHDVDFGLVGHAKVLHWGGPGVTPGLSGAPIGRVFQKARDLGVKTSLDTCYDGSGAWLSLIEAALPHLDIALTSLEEARLYTGQTTPEAIAKFLHGYGVSTVLVKLGADGVYFADKRTSGTLPAHKVRVVDTTGAGDAACAGFLYGYIMGWDLPRCARMANAAGALTVQVMGGAEGVHSFDDALRLVET